MAENLLDAGFEVTGFRRSSLEEFTARGGKPARSAADVMAASDVVVTCLPTTEALREAIAGPMGLVRSARAGQVVIDVTTAPVPAKEELRAQLRAAGADMLDCPVSGRPDVMRARKAPIFVSGDEASVARCRPVLDALSPRQLYLGPFGAGCKMKFIANLLLAVHVMATAEAVEIGARAGFTPQMILEAIGSSAASSEQLRLRAPTIAAGRSPAATGTPGNFRKDLGTIHDFVRGVGAVSPLFDTAFEHFIEAEDAGFGGQDTVLVFTALLRHLADHARDEKVI